MTSVTPDQPAKNTDPADAAIVAVLRLLERNGIDREVLADLTDSAQAAVFAAEARIVRGAR